VKIYIGTSGWHYKHWLNGVFYPAGTSGRAMFEFYARHFNTVEINNSFYRLPTATTFDNWRESAPRGLSVCSQSQPLYHAHEEAEGTEELV
jgi:uncharacterized protein YecE (DUF72 family)